MSTPRNPPLPRPVANAFGVAVAVAIAVGIASCRLGVTRPAGRAPQAGLPTASAQSPIPPALAAQLLPWDHAVAVSHVIDGDTLRVVAAPGRTETVRLIGLNAPETGDGRRTVQCFGRQATDHLRAQLDGEEVWLAGDPTQDSRDRYGRLLAYAWLTDGTLLNRALLADGYANEFTYDRPYVLRDGFRTAAAAARASDRGLWAPATCNGDFNAPAVR